MKLITSSELIALLLILVTCARTGSNARSITSATAVARSYLVGTDMKEALGFNFDTTIVPIVRSHGDSTYVIEFSDTTRNVFLSLMVRAYGEPEVSIGRLDDDMPSALDIRERANSILVAREFLLKPENRSSLAFEVDDTWATSSQEFSEAHYDVLFLDSLHNVYVQVIVRYGEAISLKVGAIDESLPNLLDSTDH